MLPNRRKQIADCEVCDKTKVEVTTAQPGNILMCDDCLKINDEAVAASKNVNKIIEDSRKIDSSITMKADVFLAKTVAAVELHAAIQHDENIPADQKDYVYAQECMARYKNLQKVIFEDRQALLEKENEMRMWQVNTQTAAGKLRAELRTQFKELDVNYQPAPITKKQKTTKPVKAGKPFDKKALYEAAKKYNVPAHAVQMMVTSKNLSPESAAKTLAEQMGLL